MLTPTFDSLLIRAGGFFLPLLLTSAVFAADVVMPPADEADFFSHHIISFSADTISLPDTTGSGQNHIIEQVKLQATLHSGNNNTGRIELKDIDIKAGKSDLSGVVILDLTGKRPALAAELNSTLIDLVPFITEEEVTEKKKVFSSAPLQLQALRGTDLEITFNANQLLATEMSYNDLTIALSLKDGKLRLKPLNAGLAGGNITMNLMLDASNHKSVNFNTQIELKNIQPANFPDLKNQITGANTDISINAVGAGNSMAEIMAGLNGSLLVIVGEGHIKSDRFKLLDSELIGSTLSALNPLSKKESGRHINCGVIKFDIHEGIAMTDKGIALSTRRMNVIGSGIIDLKTEQLDIGIVPKAKKGIGISARGFSELVRLGGTLAEPKAVPDTIAALKKAASVGAAVATAGVSMLAQGLFSWATSDNDPCMTALESTSENQSVTGKTVDAIKDTGTAVKDSIKGLFD